MLQLLVGAAVGQVVDLRMRLRWGRVRAVRVAGGVGHLLRLLLRLLLLIHLLLLLLRTPPVLRRPVLSLLLLRRLPLGVLLHVGLLGRHLRSTLLCWNRECILPGARLLLLLLLLLLWRLLATTTGARRHHPIIRHK